MLSPSWISTAINGKKKHKIISKSLPTVPPRIGPLVITTSPEDGYPSAITEEACMFGSIPVGTTSASQAEEEV
jgi:hypothetical protein